MVRKLWSRMSVACAVGLAHALAATYAAAQAPPPYTIVLRARGSEVAPQHNKDGAVSGGYIEVTQQLPSAVTFLLRGSVAAAAQQHKGGEASMKFVLDQEFEIVAARAGLRPPRLILTGQLVGYLTSTEPEGGNAEQGAACATVNSGTQPLLNFCVKPHAVGPTQNLFVNDRQGCELAIAPGCFSLHETFDLGASAPPIEHWCPKIVPGAAAVFGPDPRFGSRFNYILQPFTAVPLGDFGFRVVLQVVEEAPSPRGPESLPRPQRVEISRELPGGSGTAK